MREVKVLRLDEEARGRRQGKVHPVVDTPLKRQSGVTAKTAEGGLDLVTDGT